MGWLSGELVLAALVALCGVIILAGALRMRGRGKPSPCRGSRSSDRGDRA